MFGIMLVGKSEREILMAFANLEDQCEHGPECADCTYMRTLAAVAARMLKSGDSGDRCVGRCIEEAERCRKMEPSRN